jgi:phosphoribosyl-ATP pyrophosphohydrolase
MGLPPLRASPILMVLNSEKYQQESDLTFKTSLAAILSAAVLAFAAPVVAQESQPAQIAAEDVTDAQVEAFVDAILAVEQVRDEYGAPIQAAEDEAAQQKLVEEANEAAFAAVDAVENMDVDTYVAIANAAGDNEDLNQRVIARLSEVRQE